MSVEQQSKEIVREFLEEVFNKQKVELIDEFLAPDYVLHHPGVPGPMGRDAFPEFVACFPAGFADFAIRVKSVIAEADEVAVRFVLSGVHHGTFMGVEATGRDVELPGIAFYRLRNGKIVEDRPIIDWALMLEQMEVL